MAYNTWFHIVNLMRLLDITWYIDKEWFHLSGYINSQNPCIWATKHPHTIYEVPIYSEKTGMWYTISRCHIFGQLFHILFVTTCKSSINLWIQSMNYSPKMAVFNLIVLLVTFCIKTWLKSEIFWRPDYFKGFMVNSTWCFSVECLNLKNVYKNV